MSSAPEPVDLVLVPGLAFDLWGARLGRGAGYYDELIGRMSRRVVRALHTGGAGPFSRLEPILLPNSGGGATVGLHVALR